jgi:hypothetical protein
MFLYFRMQIMYLYVIELDAVEDVISSMMV